MLTSCPASGSTPSTPIRRSASTSTFATSATEDDDLQYGFEFLTDEQAGGDGHHWYRVGDILEVSEPGEPIFEYVTQHDLTKTTAFRTLSRLWKAVHEDGVISYFEEKEQSLSKVLDIFVRVNSGGVVLTKSDLLLSIATAQFEGRDATEEIHGLVDDLNETKPGFKFTKDSRAEGRAGADRHQRCRVPSRELHRQRT